MQVEMPQRLAAEKWSLVRQEALAMATIMRQNARFSGASKVVRIVANISSVVLNKGKTRGEGECETGERVTRCWWAV